MSRDTVHLVDAKQVDYQYFDDDPDGDQDRAGDGLYFLLPGEQDWNGPWHSQDEAECYAHQALKAQETSELTRDLEKDGYLCVEKNSSPERYSFINKIEGRWYAIDVTADRVSARETFGFGQNRIVEFFDFEPIDGIFGYRRRAAKQAVAAIVQEFANKPTMGM